MENKPIIFTLTVVDPNSQEVTKATQDVSWTLLEHRSDNTKSTEELLRYIINDLANEVINQMLKPLYERDQRGREALHTTPGMESFLQKRLQKPDYRITADQLESMKRASPGWETAKDIFDEVLADELKLMKDSPDK